LEKRVKSREQRERKGMALVKPRQPQREREERELV
jgi:hypothetical protein